MERIGEPEAMGDILQVNRQRKDLKYAPANTTAAVISMRHTRGRIFSPKTDHITKTQPFGAIPSSLLSVVGPADQFRRYCGI